MKINLVLQSNDFSCFGCCAAMVTGKTEKDFFDFVGHNGIEKEGFNFSEVIRYLLQYNLYPGMFGLDMPTNEPLSNFESDFSFCINFGKYKNPLILCVLNAENPDKKELHSIVLNIENREFKIFDPAPMHKGRKTSDYLLYSVLPVISMENMT